MVCGIGHEGLKCPPIANSKVQVIGVSEFQKRIGHGKFPLGQIDQAACFLK
jgi:hypothetical protein